MHWEACMFFPVELVSGFFGVYSHSACVYAQPLSRVRLFATPWIATFQAPLSIGFSRQEYWSGLPFPSLGDLPYPGIQPALCVSCIGSWILCHCTHWEDQPHSKAVFISFWAHKWHFIVMLSSSIFDLLGSFFRILRPDHQNQQRIPTSRQSLSAMVAFPSSCQLASASEPISFLEGFALIIWYLCCSHPGHSPFLHSSAIYHKHYKWRD